MGDEQQIHNLIVRYTHYLDKMFVKMATNSSILTNFTFAP